MTNQKWEPREKETIIVMLGGGGNVKKEEKKTLLFGVGTKCNGLREFKRASVSDKPKESVGIKKIEKTQKKVVEKGGEKEDLHDFIHSERKSY